MAPRHQAPRGTRDLLPADTARWRWAEDRARDVLERYGYGEIRTPMFEDYELFARTSGESSDVVQKEMYRFSDLGERELALRPEFTAGVMRAYLEHGLGGRARVHRLWSGGPVFRYGRPQKGRYRQFSQINCELIGSPAPGADVEIITLFVDLYRAWGFENLEVRVNSLGQPETRRTYGEALRAALAGVRHQLSADSQKRLEANPLRILDTKDEGDRKLLGIHDTQGDIPDHDRTIIGVTGALGDLPRLLDFLDAEDRAHWDAVLAGLKAADIPHYIDNGLVRGLDYYTRTAFEVHDRSLGAQSALGGGGRYDGLIEMLGGPPTPGVGFAIGMDRALMSMSPTPDPTGPYLFVSADATTSARAGLLVRLLRQRYRVEFDVESRSIKTQMGLAGKSGARFCVIFRERESLIGKIGLKDLRTEVQEDHEFGDLLTAIGQGVPPASPPSGSSADWDREVAETKRRLFGQDATNDVTKYFRSDDPETGASE